MNTWSSCPSFDAKIKEYQAFYYPKVDKHYIMGFPPIPKKIHICSASLEDMAPIVKTHVIRLVEAHPDFQVIYYSNDAQACYMKTKASDRSMRNYLRITDDYQVAKCDFFRPHVLKYEGGIYLDITGRWYDERGLMSKTPLPGGFVGIGWGFGNQQRVADGCRAI